MVDVLADHNAVKEASVLGVPVVGVVDSNADPTPIQYVVPGNDDAIKGVQLLLDYFGAAVAEGVAKKGDA